ncbi:hypothetical protein BDW60DRAFT_103153 [Aspergillus nidulans var. acristatus]
MARSSESVSRVRVTYKALQKLPSNIWSKLVKVVPRHWRGNGSNPHHNGAGQTRSRYMAQTGSWDRVHHKASPVNRDVERLAGLANSSVGSSHLSGSSRRGSGHIKAPEPSSTADRGSLYRYLTDRGNLTRAPILVQRPGGNPDNAIQMVATVDTGNEGPNLMALRHFKRVNKGGKVVLEPLDAEIEGVGGSRVKAIGMVRGLNWQFKNGFKTYESDFCVVDMPRYDVLISWGTIWKYKILKLGSDLTHHLEQAALKQKRGQQFR